MGGGIRNCWYMSGIMGHSCDPAKRMVVQSQPGYMRCSLKRKRDRREREKGREEEREEGRKEEAPHGADLISQARNVQGSE